MESNWPQDTFATHPLEAGAEFNLGDSESVTEMEGAVHVLQAGTCADPLVGGSHV